VIGALAKVRANAVYLDGELLLFPTPAEACHRFRYWAIRSRNTSRAPARRPKPRLRTEITWGETGDGRLVAIGMLRALSDGR
jgi:hypothetical protein